MKVVSAFNYKSYDDMSEQEKLDYTAAGLSRVYDKISKMKAGTISAWRSYSKELWDNYNHKDIATGVIPEQDKQPYAISNNQNRARDKKIRAVLKQNADKIGYIRVMGTYQESAASDKNFEESYLVFAKDNSFDLKSFLLNLGKTFEQDSITYADAGKGFSLICSTPYNVISDWKGNLFKFGDIMETFNSVHFGDTFVIDDYGMKVHNKVYSQIRNRPFMWVNYNAKSSDDNFSLQIQSSLRGNRTFTGSGFRKRALYNVAGFNLSDIIKD